MAINELKKVGPNKGQVVAECFANVGKDLSCVQLLRLMSGGPPAYAVMLDDCVIHFLYSDAYPKAWASYCTCIKAEALDTFADVCRSLPVEG